MATVDAFPELDRERERLAYARAARERMIDRLERVDPESAADEFTAEYVEVTVEEALEDLRAPGAGDFFGRIDTTGDCWYIGRRHIEDDEHDPVVVDWRAPIAAPFYRATAADPLGVDLRRRFTLDDGELTAYLDEHLDDPDAADVAGGIPDPVLAEIGAERTGAMREIVATIQAEQDHVIRAPIDQVLVVQGGPGTGKTAVALHRAAYLLFEHRRRLARDGVLVIGPNRAFLDYVANVLPSLGERSVRQCTVLDLCVPKVEITAEDDPPTARSKGDVAMLEALERAALAAIVPPEHDVVVPVGLRRVVFKRGEIGEWLERAADAVIPVNQRRLRLRSIAQQELMRRTGRDDVWPQAGDLRSAIGAAWPTQQPARLVDRLLPGRRGRRRAWTAADQLLVDEANSLLNGPPLTYGHVVVDEAQDHSAIALRVIGRRSPAGSMTLVGDVAQSTTPSGQERWDDVFAYVAPVGGQRDRRAVAELSIGYRVPEPILSVANRLLPLTGVDGREPERADREPPAVLGPHQSGRARHRGRHGDRRPQAQVATHRGDRAARAARRDRHGVAQRRAGGCRSPPSAAPRRGATVRAGAGEGPRVRRRRGRGTRCDPRRHAAGARLLYVAMTRAVQELAFVTTRPGPTPVIAPGPVRT